MFVPRITDSYTHYWAHQAYAAFNYREGLAAYCALCGRTSSAPIENIVASHGRIPPRTPPPTGGNKREEGEWSPPDLVHSPSGGGRPLRREPTPELTTPHARGLGRRSRRRQGSTLASAFVRADQDCIQKLRLKWMHNVQRQTASADADAELISLPAGEMDTAASDLSAWLNTLPDRRSPLLRLHTTRLPGPPSDDDGFPPATPAELAAERAEKAERAAV